MTLQTYSWAVQPRIDVPQGKKPKPTMTWAEMAKAEGQKRRLPHLGNDGTGKSDAELEVDILEALKAGEMLASKIAREVCSDRHRVIAFLRGLEGRGKVTSERRYRSIYWILTASPEIAEGR